VLQLQCTSNEKIGFAYPVVSEPLDYLSNIITFLMMQTVG